MAKNKAICPDFYREIFLKIYLGKKENDNQKIFDLFL